MPRTLPLAAAAALAAMYGAAFSPHDVRLFVAALHGVDARTISFLGLPLAVPVMTPFVFLATIEVKDAVLAARVRRGATRAALFLLGAAPILALLLALAARDGVVQIAAAAVLATAAWLAARTFPRALVVAPVFFTLASAIAGRACAASPALIDRLLPRW